MRLPPAGATPLESVGALSAPADPLAGFGGRFAAGDEKEMGGKGKAKERTRRKRRGKGRREDGRGREGPWDYIFPVGFITSVGPCNIGQAWLRQIFKKSRYFPTLLCGFDSNSPRFMISFRVLSLLSLFNSGFSTSNNWDTRISRHLHNLHHRLHY